MRDEAPAWQRAAVRDLGRVEPIFENRDFVKNHEQMECDGNQERVREDGHATEEPSLAAEDGEKRRGGAACLSQETFGKAHSQRQHPAEKPRRIVRGLREEPSLSPTAPPNVN